MLRRSAALVLLCLSAVAALASSGANATRTPVPDIVSIETYPFSAVVRWRVPDAGRVVLEVGVDDRYGIWSPTTVAHSALTSRTTLAGLEPATTYRFRVLTRWRNGMRRSLRPAGFVLPGFPNRRQRICCESPRPGRSLA